MLGEAGHSGLVLGFNAWHLVQARHDIVEANVNAQRVVSLRLTKLAKGGPAAERAGWLLKNLLPRLRPGRR